MRKLGLLFVIGVALVLFLAACGGGGDDSGSDAAAPAPRGSEVGDAANGEELYKRPTIGSAGAPGCNTCHSLEEGVTLVGPSHANIGTRAETAVAGQSAEAYLRESIVDPNAHVTEGYTAGVMYPNYAQDLTEEQIDDLVAFLLTQR